VWVCYSTPNLALVGKRGLVQEPQKSKFAKKVWLWPPEADTMNTFPYMPIFVQIEGTFCGRTDVHNNSWYAHTYAWMDGLI